MYYQRKINYHLNYIRKLKKTNPGLSRLLQLKHPPALQDVNVIQQPTLLPTKIAQSYDYTVEEGLKLRSSPLHHYKWLIVTIAVGIFPLLWWLNSSSASFLDSQLSLAEVSTDSLKQHSLTSLLGIGNSSGSMLPTVNSMSVLPSIAMRSASLLAQRTEESLANSLEKVQSTFNTIQAKLPKLPASPWLKIIVQSGDTLSTIFQTHQLNKVQLHEMASLKKHGKQLQDLRPGQQIRIKRDPETGQVEELILAIDFENELRIHYQKQRLMGEVQPRDREVKIMSAQVSIRNSLYAEGKKAGVSQELIDKSVKILRLDKNFIKKMRRGDQFAIVYEKYIIGKKQKDGEILAVKFVTRKGKNTDTEAAVRYTDDTGITGYYTPEGDALKDAFLKSPAPSARITSYFGVREHPIFHMQREHKGIDYAAPSGTPVLAISDGSITSIGWQTGYGKVVEIKHSNQYSSLYAHLSQYAAKLEIGQHIKQGQVIAYIGRTGLATGPHLHFEFHVNDVPVNPLTVKLPNSVPIAEKYRADFLAESKSLMTQLDQTTTVADASVNEPKKVRPPIPKLSKLAQLVNGSITQAIR